jgi:MoaA/NifB/PqqE/SkfB family radical SAM enzyme
VISSDFFCEHTFGKDKHADIDPDLLYKILCEMAEVGVEEVGLFWIGESLLFKRLPEYVAYTKSLGCRNVYLTTNGRLATPARVEALIEVGLNSIKFSVSGFNRQNYITVMGVDAFEKVMRNIRHT